MRLLMISSNIAPTFAPPVSYFFLFASASANSRRNHAESPKTASGFFRLCPQLARLFLRRLHADQRRPRHLAALLVHAGLLSQILCVAPYVQQIVVDLERESDARAECPQRGDRFFIRTGNIRRSQQRRGQQIRRLMHVNIVQRGFVRLPDAR